MKELMNFLETSYTPYQAVENAVRLLKDNGFQPLSEGEPFRLTEGGKYYVTRGASALIAFTAGAGEGFKIVASHTDSPCLKVKENPVMKAEGVVKLNTEPYGGGIRYSLFDRPLKLAGRIVRERDGALVSENYVGDFTLVLPSLAIHMQREVNEKFAPDPQVDLLPLLSTEPADFSALTEGAISYDLFVVPAEKPFESGLHREFLSSPRIDNLTSVYASLLSLAKTGTRGVCVAACLDSEEIGSGTYRGAGSDFLKSTLLRIAQARGICGEDFHRALSTSFLISLDNAHAVHPNHPEKCDPTNRAALGGGVVIKSHAGGAYTTDALSSAVVKSLFARAGVKYQTFFNRSDLRSGGTLGAISLGQVGVPSVDLGIAQLAMHSAVETFLKQDFDELLKGLAAFYAASLSIDGSSVQIG